jgi:hypothetical protein
MKINDLGNLFYCVHLNVVQQDNVKYFKTCLDILTIVSMASSINKKTELLSPVMRSLFKEDFKDGVPSADHYEPHCWLLHQ